MRGMPFERMEINNPLNCLLPIQTFNFSRKELDVIPVPPLGEERIILRYG